MFYYEIHVFFSRSNGYSVGLTSTVDLSNDEDIIAEAVKQNKFTESGDEDSVDYVETLTEQEYKEMFCN